MIMKVKKIRQTLLKVASALVKSPSDPSGEGTSWGICRLLRKIKNATTAGTIIRSKPMISSV